MRYIKIIFGSENTFYILIDFILKIDYIFSKKKFDVLQNHLLINWTISISFSIFVSLIKIWLENKNQDVLILNFASDIIMKCKLKSQVLIINYFNLFM